MDLKPIARHAARVLRGKSQTNPLWKDDQIEALSFKRKFFWNAFRALAFNRIDGDYVEFGSWGGMTFGLAHAEIERRRLSTRMWAFDSFAGLPEPAGPEDEHPRWKEGAMSTSVVEFHRICSDHGIPRDRYETVPGYYDETLVRLGSSGGPTNISLAYVDCDLYSSTKTVLEFLIPRMKHGMIIAFDDYYCWSSDQLSGERRAALELLFDLDAWHMEPYLKYGWAGASFVVEDRTLFPGS